MRNGRGVEAAIREAVAGRHVRVAAGKDADVWIFFGSEVAEVFFDEPVIEERHDRRKQLHLGHPLRLVVYLELFVGRARVGGTLGGDLVQGPPRHVAHHKSGDFAAIPLAPLNGLLLQLQLVDSCGCELRPRELRQASDVPREEKFEQVWLLNDAAEAAPVGARDGSFEAPDEPEVRLGGYCGVLFLFRPELGQEQPQRRPLQDELVAKRSRLRGAVADIRHHRRQRLQHPRHGMAERRGLRVGHCDGHAASLHWHVHVPARQGPDVGRRRRWCESEVDVLLLGGVVDNLGGVAVQHDAE